VSEGIHLKLFTSTVKGSCKFKVEPGLLAFKQEVELGDLLRSLPIWKFLWT